MPTTAHPWAVLGALAGLCLAAPARAGNSVALPGSIAPFSRTVQVAGVADPAAVVHFQVVLRLRDPAGMQARIDAGQSFSPAELEASQLPLQADHDAVLAWLQSAGLTIDSTVPTRMTISVSGRADRVSAALGVHFSHIVSEGRDFTAADTPASIPARFAGIILSINGLQPHAHAHTMIEPITGNSGIIPYIPSDLLKYYSTTSGSTGANTTTAIVIDTFPRTSDITTFWSEAKVAQSLSRITFIQAVSGTLPAPSGEETLDTQYSSGIAPAGKVRVYAAQSLYNSALDTTFQRVISDMHAGVSITQVSISLGECETAISSGEAETDNQYFATMTALGASVFVSSGDSGSHTCGSGTSEPSFFSTATNVTAVGGTTLSMSGPNKTSETAWTGSGGGISTIFARPAYQSTLDYAMRAVPDVSADANPNTGVLIIVKGTPIQVGGTSVSAPVWAGFAARINGSRLAAGKKTLGLLNTRVYPLLKTGNFRDITTGGNGGYSAGIGYDLVTGIGSPVMSSLLPTLVNEP